MKSLPERIQHFLERIPAHADNSVDGESYKILLEEAHKALVAHEKKYDSTLARMAGNMAPAFFRNPIHSTIVQLTERDRKEIAFNSVELARAIIEEIRRTT